uniref:Uncharacterized protein n=1 Tax=Rhizophora mucronata TaxID=61149 RepID=A0A2P2N3Z3_RHIMU
MVRNARASLSLPFSPSLYLFLVLMWMYLNL